jgi:hypothetical protein
MRFAQPGHEARLPEEPHNLVTEALTEWSQRELPGA